MQKGDSQGRMKSMYFFEKKRRISAIRQGVHRQQAIPIGILSSYSELFQILQNTGNQEQNPNLFS